MSLRKVDYSKEEATSLYLKLYRYKILNELRVCEVQKRIRNKLTDYKSDEVEILFCSESNLEITDFSGILSTDGSIHDTNMVKELYKKEKEDKKDENQIVTHVYKKSENDVRRQKVCKKYIDFEATCSEEEEEEEEEEYDIQLINEEVVETVASTKLYYEEKQKEDEKILKIMKKKYKKYKKVIMGQTAYEIVEDSDEKHEGFSEMYIDGEDIKFDYKEMDMVQEEQNIQVDNSVSFRNLENIQKVDTSKKTLFDYFKKK